MLLENTLNHLNIGIRPLAYQPKDIRIAIEGLVKAFDDAIKRKLTPKLYLSAVDCGLGKTTALCRFLYQWKLAGFLPDNGVLIITPNLSDIESIIRNSELEETDYAILTPDKAYCDRGLGAQKSNRAKVLFITQAMLKKRLAKKKMLDADEFAYRGHPRSLRVCDEAILPAEPINISIDKLLGLIAPLRPFDETYVERVRGFAAAMLAEPPGTTVTIPSTFRPHPHGIKADGTTALAALSDEQHNLIKALSMVAGRSLRLMDGAKYGRALVGYGPALPDDLAPMIIMDASARIRSIYDIWGRDRGNLVRLPAATSRYDNLIINIWKRACGRAVLATDRDRAEILEHVAAIINAKATEQWIVICPKDNALAGHKVQLELPDRLTIKDNVGFVTWGRHIGTNEFRGCRNVIVIGAFRLPTLTYQARYMAASGKPIASFNGDEWKEIWISELQDVILQSISRSNARNGCGGVCGEATVHMVMGPNPDPIAMMAELFPGATIGAWEPILPVLRGQALTLVETLKELRSEKVAMVAKERLRDRCGISSPSRFSQLLADAKVKAHFREIGVRIKHAMIYFDEGLVLAA